MAIWVREFGQHPILKRLRQTLTAPVAQPIWWEIPNAAPASLDYSVACRTCRFVRKSPMNRRLCQRRFLKALGAARKTRAPLQFLCPIQRYAVCLPVLKAGEIHGYLALCHSERSVPHVDLELASLTVESICQETERAQELKTLSETIQPRCVALSTIHTIHRLISSTLNLEELLPRVARLCCQVLRAQFCAIWLKDKEKPQLSPRAAVHRDEPSPGPSSRRRVLPPCRIGVGLVGRTAKTCKATLTPRLMIVPLVEEDCLGVIVVKRKPKANAFGTLDHEILTTLSEQAVVAIRNAQMYETQERVAWGTIKSLSGILDGMDPYSFHPSSGRRIMADVAIAIAYRLKLPSSQQKSLQYAALLHDAGRVGLPEEILRKPSKLEPAEFAKVKEHPIQGARLLQPLEILEPAIPIILHHHERYDGTGYPKGLKKEGIPLGARILAVANAFEAMVCERPYRQAMSIAKATHEIESHAGTQFDPKVVQAFLKVARSGELEGLVHSKAVRRSQDGGS